MKKTVRCAIKNYSKMDTEKTCPLYLPGHLPHSMQPNYHND